MQQVCGVIGALDINLGKKESFLPCRSLIFQWLFYLPSAEVVFIGHFLVALIRLQGPCSVNRICRDWVAGVVTSSTYCPGCAARLSPALTLKQRAGCWQPACSARTLWVSGKKNTKYWFFSKSFNWTWILLKWHSSKEEDKQRALLRGSVIKLGILKGSLCWSFELHLVPGVPSFLGLVVTRRCSNSCYLRGSVQG